MGGEYMFGSGSGHLSQRVARAVKREGVELVNYTDPGCGCGHGCARHCEARKRHWFSGPNRGDPFDKELGDRIARLVRSVATESDLVLLNSDKVNA